MLPVNKTRQENNGTDQFSDCAASACLASSNSVVKNLMLWPANNPDFDRPVAAATAPAFAVSVGRITETNGRLVLMNLHGAGMTWFVKLG
jgi:hypothetical protein